MFQQLLFHLCGADIEPAGDDDLFLAIDYGDEPVRIHRDHIPGTQPASQQGDRGLVRIAPIALENLRPLQHQLARLTDPDLTPGIVDSHHLHQGGRERHPDRAGSPAREERIAQGHRGGLGQPISLDQQTAGHRLPQLPGLLHQGHRPRDAPACAGKIYPAPAGAFGGALVERGHHAVDAGRGLAGGSQDQIDVRLGEQHLTGLFQYPEGGVHGHAEGVEHRQGGIVDLAPRLSPQHPGLTLTGIGVQVEVGQHGPPGASGGARGVLNGRQIMHLGTRMTPAYRAVAHQPLPAQGAPGAAAQRLASSSQTGQR